MAVEEEMNIFSHNKVTCSGEQSCASAYISTSSALQCTASEGCAKMRAESKGRVYCSSDRSCASASIVKHYTGDDIDDLVHCDSENACREATITGITYMDLHRVYCTNVYVIRVWKWCRVQRIEQLQIVSC